MTTPQTVLPEGERPRPQRSASSLRERLALGAVALFVVSGAAAWALRDDAPVEVPVPQTATHAQLVTEATRACTAVTTSGYTWAQLVVLSERLHRFSVPGPDVTTWAAALRALDSAVAVEKAALDARPRPGAAATPRQAAARTAPQPALNAAGIPASPGCGNQG